MADQQMTLELTIPDTMMPDIVALQGADETLHDCILELLWVGVLRMKNRVAGVNQT